MSSVFPHSSSDASVWLSRLAELLAVTPDYVVTTALDGTILWANRSLEALIGEPLVGQNVSAFRPDWVHRLLMDEGRPTAVRTGHWVGLTAVQPPGQGERSVRQVLVPHHNELGELEGFSAVMQDLAEDEEIVERLRVLSDTVPVGIFRNDAQGRCVWVNAKYKAMVGLSFEDCLDYGWMDALAPESRDLLDKARTALERDETFGPENVEYLRPDGERRTASVRVALVRARDGTVQGQVGVAADITARRAEQRALEESEERFRAVLESIEEGIVLQDETGAIRLWNRATERILGLSAAQLLGTTSSSPRWKTIDGDGRELSGDEHPAMVVLRSGQPLTAFVMGVQRPDSTQVWLRISSRPISLSGPEGLHGAVTTFVDITAEREAEELLRKSERQLRVVTAAAREAICLHAADGRYEWVSEGAREVLGWEADELVGADPYACFHPDDTERIRSESHERLLTGERTLSITYRFRRSDGSYSWVETTSNVVPATETAPLRIVTTSRSADLRVAADARSAVRNRLGGVAQFAGRLAHDLTNLFTVVQGRLELAREQSRGDALDDIDAAVGAIGRATELTQALRALSGHEPLLVERFDLRDVVTSIEREVRLVCGDSISLRVELSAHPLVASGDRAALAQGVRSIVANACEAMQGHGRLSLHVERVSLTSRLAHAHGEVPSGTWAVLRCVDSGPGIAADQLANVFEPGLSSKQQNVETGLGLPITLARVEQMGGHVSVANVPEGGAEVRVWLPLVSPNTTPRSSPTVSDRRADGRQRPATAIASESPVHVLLVDDDAPVLRTVQRLLQRAGFRVSTAESGFDALAVLAAAADDIAVIVTDVMMPGLSGPQFVAKRRALGDIRPVIYISGYTGDALPAALLPEAGAALISKPFASSDLVEAINAALGRARPAPNR